MARGTARDETFAAACREGREETATAAARNVEQLLEISATETAYLKIESQRPDTGAGSLKAQEARVEQRERVMCVNEAKVMTTTESDTYIHTGISCGPYEDTVVFTIRAGSEAAATLQADACCVDTMTRMRMDCRNEAGLLPLYTTPINTDFGVFYFICRRG